MIGAIDIGGTKIAVGMVDERGHLLSRAECPTDPQAGFPNALRRMWEMLLQCSESAGATITGIGIGCTGPVDPLTGTIGDVFLLPGWQGSKIVVELCRALSVPVAMENDADAAALGEAAWGAGKGKSSLIYVTVGTGIGAGIILSGHLYRGADGFHPEVGHHVIDPNGPLCSCGARGCWEAMASGPAMVEWLLNQAPPDYPHRDGLTAKRICELALEGDKLASQAVERESFCLGLGLANLITLFAPDSIVLGGSVIKSAKLFFDGIHKVIQQNCKLVSPDKTEITLASLGESANLIGAARVWYHRFAQGGGNGS